MECNENSFYTVMFVEEWQGKKVYTCLVQMLSFQYFQFAVSWIHRWGTHGHRESTVYEIIWDSGANKCPVHTAAVCILSQNLRNINFIYSVVKAKMQLISYSSSKTSDLYPKTIKEKRKYGITLNGHNVRLIIPGTTLLFIKTSQQCHFTD